MLQGLRRTIGRYAPIGGVREAPEDECKQEQEALKDNAMPLEAAVWHFTRQARALTRLEHEMRQMLDQIQVAFTSMVTVAEIFCETCSADEDETCGRDYKAAMKQIEQEDVERMEQSIRFTILDPLQARLERYDQLKKDIHVWEKLNAESKTLRAVTLKMQSSRLEDHEKRIHAELDLHRVATLLQETEAALLPQLEDAIQSGAATTSDLFNSMVSHRLQVAIFFRDANETVQSSLSSPEQEILVEANQTYKLSTTMRYDPYSVSSSKLNKLSSQASDGWTEVEGSSSSIALDGVEAISGSDEDDESNISSNAVEEFEAGKMPRIMKTSAVVESTVDMFKPVNVSPHNGQRAKEKNALDEQSSKMLRLTSTQAANFKAATPRRTVSVLSSIRKTIRGTFNYASAEARMIRQTSAPIPGPAVGSIQNTAILARKNGEHLFIISPPPSDWIAIEDCLWEIDVREARFIGKPLLQTECISSETNDLLSKLFRKVCVFVVFYVAFTKLADNEALCFECLSFLRVEDLARLSKVNFWLHSRLLDSAPIWKKCIRLGGLSPTIRSSLWLSVFYESTPWRSCGIASHCLSAERRSSMYDQLMTKVEMKVAEGLVQGGLPLSDDNPQLAVWFREIDVDVVRTCHRKSDAKASLHSFPTVPAAAVDKSHQVSVESILTDIVNTIVKTEENDGASHGRSTQDLSDAKHTVLEAKVRRVLRAYVVYNPRVGYCQGMSFLVRLLAEVADDEANIFWLFVGFSEPENNRNLYEPGMAVLQPYLSKFEMLFASHMPELYAHLQVEGVHVATFCTRWFLTFFSSFETLPPKLVTHLLDIFILDGWRIMFSVSLVILNELQPQLRKCDMEGILRILQFPRSYMPEPDSLRQRQLVRHALAYSVSRAMNSI
ncbi:hypothetical protein PsorP6_008262 [Peronosclerospora sorghi]|uniref:Uncharacterized protein n=1 Tax=Peronosclerospora sorghi TaxID=230839 RepID=A0ACC0WBS0_9STRA|nr:hypothetical protein PsorP6_008262 [Peronosclerospora sorghi]